MPDCPCQSAMIPPGNWGMHWGTMTFSRTRSPVGEFLTLTNDSWVGHSIREYAEWSYGEIETLAQLLTPESNVIEAGSNIGSHTVFIARDLCPKGQVFAFEPRRIVFQLLCGNLVLNGITNVHAYQMGVGDKEETISEAALPLDIETNFGAYAAGAIKGDQEILKLIPLDSMLHELPRIRLIKADVEGYEANLLHGATQLIARDRPVLYLENDRPDKSEELLTLVSSLGYQSYWHIPVLYRANNFTQNPVNHFPTVASFNILCLPQEAKWTISGSDPITDFKQHPLAKT